MNTIAGRRVVCIKHSSDNRYSEVDIVTHSGRKTYAEIRTKNALQAIEQECDVMCIDEGQFFGEDLVDLVHHRLYDIDIYVAGLDMDIHAVPFPSMANLMALADVVVKCTAVCTEEYEGIRCGRPANHTARMTPLDKKDGPHIEVGGLETYQPRCRMCYNTLMTAILG